MRSSLCAILAIAGFAFAAPAVRATDFPSSDIRVATADSAVSGVIVAMPQASSDAVLPADATFATPIEGDTLDTLRGGAANTTRITNVSDVDGDVDGNVAVDTVSGGNLVAGGAFGNAAGLTTVIQNSGNNVLIQNSTVVSVQFAPTP